MTQRRSHHREKKAVDEGDVPEWVDQVMATVAAEIHRRRKELGWSAQDLAEKCAEIGHSIPRNVIANMESGRRSNLPLVDVIVLAEALNAPPVCLLYPVGYVKDVQRLPLQNFTSTLNALRWFTGEETALGADDDRLRYFRAHHAAQDRLRQAQQDEEHARYQAKTAPNTNRRAEALRAQAHAAEAAEEALSRLHRVRAFLEDGGVSVPHLWPDVVSAFESPESGSDTTEENGF